ncbi:SAM-dependent methyltransferase [Alkalicaulis satelles]|uniref:SAM-dependent methyltransferase n=2 Tax=Alkalicaulis satelles TaxID=2609175 RepID=A0A5M6ZAM4_9PROT|nr:SAM-dependent methyltransferase [Alkalicaulis satelles]
MLAERLRARIASEGPLPVSAFMMEALFDPMAGFYATKDPLGAHNDFITAPEISQMFGELIGLWAVECWGQMGSPDPVQLIELGPGTGRMMSDVARVLRAAPGLVEAAEATLVEASPALKMVQGRTLAGAPVPVCWAPRLEAIRPGPTLLLANEFLDCLPIRQAVKTDGVWRERCVAMHPDEAGRFAFVLGTALAQADLDLIDPSLRDLPDGTLVELRPADAPLIAALAERLHAHPGYALFIDYGSDTAEPGDTLQAIARHEKVDPLEAPGAADLTAWVNFEAVAQEGLKAGLQVFGVMGQGAFLKGLGLDVRAGLLAQGQDEAGRARITRQAARLCDPDEMGELFKVIAFASPDLPPPPGLGRYAPASEAA